MKTTIFKDADATLNGPRAADYGDAVKNHQRIADLWTVILGHKVEAYQVALCMDAVKTARLIHTPEHYDSWLDKIGYCTIGSQCMEAEK